MDSITKPLYRLGCILMICISMACASTQPTSGAIRLPAGETTSFRIANSEIRMVFSHNTVSAPTNDEEMPLFSVRFIQGGYSTPVRIYFDNEDCDPFISYSVGIQRSAGVTYEYFDNVIPVDSDIEIQVTEDDSGKQVLLVNNRSTLLDIKRNYRRLAVNADGDYSLSYTGLKPLNFNKEN